MKKVYAVAPFIREGIINFKYPPYEAWKRMGGAVAQSHYPKIKPVIGWFHNHEVPELCKSREEARLRFIEPINRKFDAFPDYAFYEIIPVIWDCWPCLDDRLSQWLGKHDVKTAIFFFFLNAHRIQQRFPKMNIFVITEGVDTSAYHAGKPLAERQIDILEYGRSNELVVNDDSFEGTRHVRTSSIKPRISDSQLFEMLSDSKITIALTKLDTDPKLAGGVDTLTQRYWENMLSRVVMIGRAPNELIELIGYNPCINVKEGECYKDVIQNVLRNIADYQQLVDRNRESALRLGDWNIRMKLVMEWLESVGYSCRPRTSTTGII